MIAFDKVTPFAPRLRDANDRFKEILGTYTGIYGTCESRLLTRLMEFSRTHEVYIRRVMYLAPVVIAEQLRDDMKVEFSIHEVYCKIIQLRHKFASFRRFLDRPDVDFGGSCTKMKICRPYYRCTAERETNEMMEFRIHGLKWYDTLRYIFIARRASTFDDEPEENYVSQVPQRLSDLPSGPAYDNASTETVQNSMDYGSQF